MVVRLTGMRLTGKGRLKRAHREQLERSCKNQVLRCYMGTGDTAENAIRAFCREIREDQLPCHADLAGLGAFPVPPKSVVLTFERLMDELESVGMGLEEFEDMWCLQGHYYLDGTRAGRDDA